MALEPCGACVSFQSGSLLQGPCQRREQVCSVRGQLARGCACSLAAEPHCGAGPPQPTASLDKAPAARFSLFPGVYVTGSHTFPHFHLSAFYPQYLFPFVNDSDR